MHATNHNQFSFHHNGDFDGKVTIRNNDTNERMEVDFEALKSLVAEYVRRKRMAELESMSDDELLE